MTRTAAITGASGFVGRHVVAAFAAAGWHCRVLLRNPAAAPALPAETIEGTLEDPAALSELVNGADTIIHIAGLTTSRDPTAFDRINAGGTASIADAWEKNAPSARFVLVSSMAAREPQLSPYAASKRRAEDALTTRSGRWCILRPSAVYGPHDASTLALFRMGLAPVQPVLGPEDARLCLIHVEDLARAVLATAVGASDSAIWELSDAQHTGYAWREMATLLAETMGRRPRAVALPRTLVDLLGIAAERLPAARKLIGPLSADKIRELRHLDWSSSAAAQPPPTLWRPTLSLAEGFEHTVRALEAAGQIPPRPTPVRGPRPRTTAEEAS
ncbi:MAG: NAD(P)-dependent oxidoreductase [Pseudomonadota bacterium]